ncbi:YrzI family small protein [Microbacteriaceae bacterium 4G12]
MTLNFIFFAITVHKRERSETEIQHDLVVRELMEEVKDRQISVYRHI